MIINIPNINFGATILCAFILIQSCKTTQKVMHKNEPIIHENQSDSHKLVESFINWNDSARVIFAQNAFDYKSLEANGQILITIENKDYNFDFNMRIISDSAIWLQFKKLGLEGMRILADKDKIQIIDRLHRTYTTKKYKDFSNFTQIELNFNSLEQFLTKIPLPKFTQFDSSFIANKMIFGHYTNGNINYKISCDSTSYLINSVQINEPKKNQKLMMEFSNFQVISELKKIPYLRDLEIQLDKKKLYVSIDFSKININTSFLLPFEIPSSYTTQH